MTTPPAAMGDGFVVPVLICLLVFLAVAALGVVLRAHRRSRSRNVGRGLSEMELYALRRRRKNDTMRRMRAVTREYRRSTQAHDDSWR